MVPNLATRIEININPRLKRSLGRCYRDRAQLSLNPLLLSPDRESLLVECLCHESAHVAVRVRFGRRAKPHGPEWRQLVMQAGYPVRTSVPTNRGENNGWNERPRANPEFRLGGPRTKSDEKSIVFGRVRDEIRRVFEAYRRIKVLVLQTFSKPSQSFTGLHDFDVLAGHRQEVFLFQVEIDAVRLQSKWYGAKLPSLVIRLPV